MSQQAMCDVSNGETRRLLRRALSWTGALMVALAVPGAAMAQGDAAAEMARKLQDPLASIAALMTDNDFLFKTGDEESSYSFQLQPVKSFAFPDKGFNFIARAVVPISGLAPEAQRPAIGDPLPAGGGYTWGAGDIQTQFFFSPTTDNAWKWGAGPVISWRSRSTDELGGAGWGAGPVGVLVGGIGEHVSVAFIGGQLWGFDGNFSTAFLQPMVYYNFPGAPGWAIGYNGQMTLNWTADSANRATLPLGFVVSKTTDLGNGSGLDLSIGPYWNVVRPDGAASWQIKYGITLLLP